MLRASVYWTAIILGWWAVAGHLLFLRLCGRLRPARFRAPDLPAAPLRFSVLVPVYNEEAIIATKVENLLALDYPDVDVWICDASTDATGRIVDRLIAAHPHIRRLTIPVPGRSGQVSTGLSHSTGDLILVTDADALLPPDTLRRMAFHFADARVGIVGAHVEPDTAYRLDRAFWHGQNGMRVLESQCGHASNASGACFGFRRSLIDRIPDDVWAEDIYIPFLANTRGWLSIYDPAIAVREVRGPARLGDFWRVKVRKSHDYIKELLRFLPAFSSMRGVWRVIFATRLTQVILFPAVVLTIATLVWTQRLVPFLVTVAALLVSLVIVRALEPSTGTTDEWSAADRLLASVLTVAVVSWATITYTVRRQGVGYTRIGTTRARES